MHSKWVFKHFRPRSGRQVGFLAALWMVGLFAGIALCSLGSFDSAALLRSAVSVAPTPLGLFLTCVLPIALIAIAFTSSLFGLAYITVFLCAASHGFCGIMIYFAQGSAAWLLRPMVLFSAGFTSVIMWWLILQSESKSRLHNNVRLAGVLSCFVYIIDLFVISPLVGDLLKYF